MNIQVVMATTAHAQKGMGEREWVSAVDSESPFVLLTCVLDADVSMVREGVTEMEEGENDPLAPEFRVLSSVGSAKLSVGSTVD